MASPIYVFGENGQTGQNGLTTIQNHLEDLVRTPDTFLDFYIENPPSRPWPKRQNGGTSQIGLTTNQNDLVRALEDYSPLGPPNAFEGLYLESPSNSLPPRRDYKRGGGNNNWASLACGVMIVCIILGIVMFGFLPGGALLWSNLNQLGPRLRPGGFGGCN